MVRKRLRSREFFGMCLGGYLLASMTMVTRFAPAAGFVSWEVGFSSDHVHPHYGRQCWLCETLYGRLLVLGCLGCSATGGWGRCDSGVERRRPRAQYVIAKAPPLPREDGKKGEDDCSRWQAIGSAQALSKGRRDTNSDRMGAALTLLSTAVARTFHPGGDMLWRRFHRTPDNFLGCRFFACTQLLAIPGGWSARLRLRLEDSRMHT